MISFDHTPPTLPVTAQAGSDPEVRPGRSAGHPDRPAGGITIEDVLRSFIRNYGPSIMESALLQYVPYGIREGFREGFLV